MKSSGQTERTPVPALVSRFLEMMAAERGAARNSLAAYGRDLQDYVASLGQSPPVPAIQSAIRSQAASVSPSDVSSSSTGRADSDASRRSRSCSRSSCN